MCANAATQDQYFVKSIPAKGACVSYSMYCLQNAAFTHIEQ